MLAPTPSRILRHTVTLKVPATADTWGKILTYTSTTLTRVCMQPTSVTRKAADNTVTTFNGLMIHDAKLSSPAIDFDAKRSTAAALGGDLKIVFGSTEYTVQIVDTLYDDEGRLHHTELYLT